DPRRSRIEASVDLRFRGQSYEISVPARGDLAMAFRREHRRRYGYASRSDRIELVTIRLVARVPRAVPRPRPPNRVAAVAPQSRRVLFDDGWHDTPVHERGRLGVDTEIEGPAVVSEDHATTIVPPGGRLRVDRFGLHDFPGTLREGDQVILNDPYHGGTHLPDVTIVRPVFVRGTLLGFAANRAHHADIGGIAPGSMPADASRLDEEGLVLEPQKFLDR